LRSRYNQFESKIQQVPVIERSLLERSREQSVKLGLYNYLLQKREETALSLSATIPTSIIIDKPAYNSKHAQPNDALLYLISGIFGFMLPVGVIYCREKFNTKVRNVSDIKLITGARVLGELSNKGKLGNVVMEPGSRTTISELFRYIRTNLCYITNSNLSKSQVLLITSGIQGEGKTFFSINLALTLSSSGKKVVLLEFDLRKPDLLKNIKLKPALGLTDYLNSDEINIDDIICPSGLSANLSVIGCGPMPECPEEAFLNPKIEQLFLHLRDRFDFIIVDTSPVGLVADAFSLADYSDSGIYLVRYNYTSKFQLGILEDIYEHNKLKNTLVVLNDAKEENRQVYGYGRYPYA
jgi:capsular exopolysaccharide synthesis family protein